jgi:pyrroline-5-carboxylate reductase
MMKKVEKIKMAILGCGNMTTPLVESFSQQFDNIDLYTYTPSQVRAKELAEKVKGTFCPTLKDIPTCSFYLIGCKPQQFDELAKDLGPFLEGECTIISLMAGKSVEVIKKYLNVKKVVRLMPNTPVKVGQGVHLIYFSPEVEENEARLLEELFSSCGEVFVFENEDQINLVTPYCGSGPAYIFEMARILISDLQSKGISQVGAEKMIKQMIYGASKLMLKSEESPGMLRDKVTSKGGVTAEALKIFGDYKWEESFKVAMKKAHEKAIKLSE